MKKRILLFYYVLVGYAGLAQTAPEGLFINSKAPDFKGKDQAGMEIHLKDLLKKGKVVLLFYRGYWCPYCNRFLSRLEDSLPMIKAKGASLIAVSPEKPENISKTVEATKAEYPVIYDEALKIMKAYDVAFEVPENTITRYRNSNIDILKINGDNGKYLPIPAVYIIDEESTIRYSFFERDYKKWPNGNNLLDNL